MDKNTSVRLYNLPRRGLDNPIVRLVLGGIIIVALASTAVAFAWPRPMSFHAIARVPVLQAAPAPSILIRWPRRVYNLPAGSSIDGLHCQAETLAYHVHVGLALYWNGRAVTVPSNIGIPFSSAISSKLGKPIDPSQLALGNYCLYALHTHTFDSSLGIIHIESPTVKTLILGQFLDVWRYTSRWDRQGGTPFIVDSRFLDTLRKARESRVHVYVNGVRTKNYAAIPLSAHELITIVLGYPLRRPVSHFKFPTGE